MSIPSNEHGLGVPEGSEGGSRIGDPGADLAGDPLSRMLDRIEASMEQPSLLDSMHQDWIARTLDQVETSGVQQPSEQHPVDTAVSASNSPASEVSSQQLRPAGPSLPSGLPAGPPALPVGHVTPMPMAGPKRVIGGKPRRRRNARRWSLLRWPFFRRFRRYGGLPAATGRDEGGSHDDADLYCELYGMRVDAAGCGECPNYRPMGKQEDGQCQYAFPNDPADAEEETPRESPSVGEDDADEEV